MRIIDITDHETEKNPGSTTIIPLDTRPGLVFRVMAGQYKTTDFTAKDGPVPVQFIHSSRADDCVHVEVKDNKLYIRQTYRVASGVMLMTLANNDWADTSEVTPVELDALTISAVTLLNGANVDVNPTKRTTGVRLTTSGYKPSSNINYAQEITTDDGQKFVYPLTLNSHQYTTDPVSYDYATADIPRIIRAFKKP